jgi:ribonucleoside-diphosphate reductase alpha chain
MMNEVNLLGLNSVAQAYSGTAAGAGAEPFFRVQTSRGYSIQGTGDPLVATVDRQGQWSEKRLGDIQIGDTLPLRKGDMQGPPRPVTLPPLGEAHWNSDHNAYVPRQVNAELAELVGYFMGDGSLHTKGIRFCVANTDPDVAHRLCHLGHSLFGIRAIKTQMKGYIQVAFHSVRLALWWDACEFTKLSPHQSHRGKGYTCHLPGAIAHTNDPQIFRGFIRGLFEADGTVVTQFVSWTTTCLEFCQEVQRLMLGLGFVTTRKTEETNANRWGHGPRYILRLLNVSTTEHFLREIGFLAQRKNSLCLNQHHPQAARHDHIPVTRCLIDELAPANDNLRKAMLLLRARRGMVTRHSAEALLSRTDDARLKHLLQFFYDEVVVSRPLQVKCSIVQVS